MSRILLVEDEVNLRRELGNFLQREGFEILEAGTLREADEKILEQPALVLLDWMLPDGQGIEALKKWRQQGCEIPMILLTARADLVDKVLGLELGANDYLTKPFEPRELVARIRVQLRQARKPSEVRTDGVIEAAGIRLLPRTREAFFDGKLLELTKMEFDLLRAFLESPNQVFSREELLRTVWGHDHRLSTRTIDTHLSQLRQKTKSELFETVHGIGYRFRPEKI